MSRSLKDLTPLTREKCLAFLDACEEAGIKVMIQETLRDYETQEAYYAQGRKPLEYVNLLRKKAGLWAITAAENKRKITWTMNSRHFSGTAFDVSLKKEGRATWSLKEDMNDNEIADYDEIGPIGESVGLTWGGRFKDKKGKPRPDRPHFQNDDATIVK
jgi:peptidoglycan L-alanyl-D-glutamate endopeptidase CwlK